VLAVQQHSCKSPDTCPFCSAVCTKLQSEAIEKHNGMGFWRFCQQCGKLEKLEAFDSNKR
jgi:hypothetical protein